MKITAAVAPSQGAPLEIREVELDDPRPDEVRVRMVAVGVCHSDIAIRDQVFPTGLPAVLGHEGTGVVEEVGSGVGNVAVGDHVLLTANSCGTCHQCVSGHMAYCEDVFGRNFACRRPDGSTAITDGGRDIGSYFFGQSSFATHVNAAARTVLVVDPGVDLRDIAPLGCGIQTGAGTVINELKPALGDTLAVFGAGAVGGGAIMGGVIAGCSRIVAVDINAERLELARELGATDVILSGTEDIGERLMEITGGRGINGAVDTTSRPEVLRAAADCLALRGTLLLVGGSKPGSEVTFEKGISLTRGWTFKTVLEGGSVFPVFVPELIRLWQAGRFPFEKMLRRYPFEKINEAIDDSIRGDTIKPILVF